MTDSERDLPASLDPATVAEIDARLAAVEAEHGVKIAFAIESGSRAWGFASPDSDYDCRFVYLRPERDYLALYPKRDVIETPLTPVLDVNGWDLTKALKLLVGGNAVIVEWLTSPIVYRALPGFRQDFLALARRIADRGAMFRHYLHMAHGQKARFLPDPDQAPIKKIFYVLRPALCLRWLRLHPDAPLAPMHFPTLCDGVGLPANLSTEIAELLERKVVTRELGHGSVPPLIRDVIDQELALGEAEPPPVEIDKTTRRAAAEAFFLDVLARQGGFR